MRGRSVAFCRTEARPVWLNFREQAENVARAELGGRCVLNHMGPTRPLKNVNSSEIIKSILMITLKT